MKSCWVGVGPNPMTAVLNRRLKVGNRDRRHTKGTPCVNRGRDWGDASTGQGMPGIAGNNWKLREARKGPPLGFSERARPSPCREFLLLAPEL